MSSEANFSANVRLGASGLQLTVRGDSDNEFQTHVMQAIAAIPTLLALEEAARNGGGAASPAAEAQAVATVVNAFNGTVVEQPAAVTPAAPVAPAQFAPVTPPAAPVAPVPPTGAGAPAAPNCVHGPMKLVPGGVSKKTGKPYNAFWACQWPDRDTQCKSVAG